jgi:DNA polymerase-1
MADAIRDGKDLHTESAMAALRLPSVTEEERQVGKTLNFSMVYGGGRPTLMRQLDIEYVEAGELLLNFHARWPGIAMVQESIRQVIVSRGFDVPLYEAAQRLDSCNYHTRGKLIGDAIERGGYITTLWGRHLHPESDHKALNALVQGCAADLMRAALVKTHHYLTDHRFESHLVSTIHDEVLIDASFGEVERLREQVPILMDHPPVSEVLPIGTDMEWTVTNWADKTAYESEALVGRAA